MTTSRTNNFIGGVVLAGIIILSIFVKFPSLSFGDKLGAILSFIAFGVVIKYALNYNSPDAPAWNRGGDRKVLVYFLLFFATLLSGLYFLNVL